MVEHAARSILILTLKDLRRRMADPAALLLNLAIPVAIVGTMALAFGRTGGGRENAPILKFVLLDLDDSPLSNLVGGSSQNSDVSSRLEVKKATSREQGLEVMRRESFTALLVIPKGFMDSLLAGRPTELELLKNPAQSVMPIAAQQGLEVLALYLSTARRFLGDDTGRIRDLILQGRGWDDTAEIAVLIESLRQRLLGVRQLLLPPLVEFKTESAGGERSGFNWIGVWMFPGVVVMALLFVALAQMRDLLREREAGTLRRQLAAPLSASPLLLAKVLAVATVVGAAHLLLLSLGTLTFHVPWGSFPALVAVSLALVFAVTGFASLFFSLVRTERQGGAFGGILVMVMSLLGGAFIPPQALPEAMRRISYLTLNHWGNEALRALTQGGGWSEIRAPLSVLVIFGLVSISLGMLLLRRRHLRGTL